MKLLVVGSGGREHAIIKKLNENPAVTEIFALPGNGGMAGDATCVDIKATDIDGIVDFAVKNAVDYAVVAPDDPLVLGCVDALNEKGIPCFGPKANAAIIEGSKVFSKDLMKKYGIPTARYETFNEAKHWFFEERLGIWEELVQKNYRVACPWPRKDMGSIGREITVAQKCHLWKIPAEEFNYNKAMDEAKDQNPGYTN